MAMAAQPLPLPFHTDGLVMGEYVNMVESWFSHLEKKALRRGSFRSVHELRKATEAFV